MIEMNRDKIDKDGDDYSDTLADLFLENAQAIGTLNDEEIAIILGIIMNLLLTMFTSGMDDIKFQIKQKILDKKLCLCVSLK